MKTIPIELKDLSALKNTLLEKARLGAQGLDKCCCSFKIKDNPLNYIYPILDWLEMETPLEDFEFFNFYQP